MITKYSKISDGLAPLFGLCFAALQRTGCNLKLLRPTIALLLIGGFFANAFAAEGDTAAISFTALDTYYISPTGNDQKAGTSPDTAWATPHHNVKCGDVIIAAAGDYVAGAYGTVFGTNNWGTVSNCPSTSGGIDGTGGIYFAILLCAGPHLTSCSVNGHSELSNREAIRVDKSNWAVEGFTTAQSENQGDGCVVATSESNTTMHHIAFINNIASTCSVNGFGTYSWSSPGGVDQSAVVGAIAYNASSSVGGGICGSGVSMIPVNGPDMSSGTHVFVAGYFGYKNINAPSGAGCNTDGEGLVFDSWACARKNSSAYQYQGVAEQNVWWLNGHSGFEVFPNCLKDGDNAQVYVFNNTSYGNEQDPKHVTDGVDAFLNQLAPTKGSGYYAIFSNIFETTQATSGNNGQTPVYAAGFYLNNLNTSLISAWSNYFWQSNPGAVTTAGNPNTDVMVNGHHNTISFPFGRNIFNDPGFANPNGLPTGAPNCGSYTNTTACMNQGYNVAANLKPSVAVGYGYQPPGPCKPDPYFPVWLKGVVFLHWNGSTLTENAGLITKPCDM
jgi:hypothetical protein